jgi:hypothetical protein
MKLDSDAKGSRIQKCCGGEQVPPEIFQIIACL